MLEEAIKKLAEEWIEEDEKKRTVFCPECDHEMPNRHDDKNHCYLEDINEPPSVRIIYNFLLARRIGVFRS